MVVLIKKGLKYNIGDTFPLVTVPLRGQGQEFVFYDFQWWGPTSEWDDWLKAHPGKSWQAESESFDSDENDLTLEDLQEDPYILGFDEFKSVFEDENEEEGGPALTEQNKKAYTKFVFAYNQLKESGKMKTTLDTSTLQKGMEYAIVGDLQNENGEADESTRQAYRMKIATDSEKACVAFCEEAIPIGKFPEDDGSGGNAVAAIAEFGAQIAASGIVGLVVIGSAWKLTKYIGGKIATLNAIRKIRSAGGGASGLSGIAGSAARAGVPRRAPVNGYYKGGKLLSGGGHAFMNSSELARRGITFVRQGDIIPGSFITKGPKGSIFKRGIKRGISRLGLKSGSRAASRMAIKILGKTGAKTTAKFIPYVGWALAIFDVIQTTANWYGDNQAPMLSDIKEGWAQEYFAPGSIPDGEEITICWSHEPDSWGYFFSSMVWDSSTRTTMNLVKLGNFDGRAMFLLVDINSKEFQKVLQEKEVVLLSFDESARFDRHWYDNDNLEFEMITYDGDGDLSFNLDFHGYCSWDEMESSYSGAEDTFLAVPGNAPKQYSFNFKYGKGNLDINVVGSLIEDVNSIEGMEAAFESLVYPGEEDYGDFSFISHLAESSEVLSFEGFRNLSEGGESNEEEGQKNSSTKEEVLTGTVKIAAYDVVEMEYADANLRNLDLPSLETFIVPDNYLEAKDQENILIDPVQDIALKFPKRGTVVVESELVPEPVSPEAVVPGGAGVTGGVPVEVSRKEIIKTYKDRPEVLNNLGVGDVSKIKDKDVKDEIRILDMITPEEKEKLGMDDWDFIRKVKIYKDGKTKEPFMVKFRGDGKRSKVKASDENFDTALRVAERIQAGFNIPEDED